MTNRISALSSMNIRTLTMKIIQKHGLSVQTWFGDDDEGYKMFSLRSQAEHECHRSNVVFFFFFFFFLLFSLFPYVRLQLTIKVLSFPTDSPRQTM